MHSSDSAKKGTKVPRKCLPRTEDEDQGDRGGGGARGGGRQPLWEPGRGGSSYRKLDRRENSRRSSSDSSRYDQPLGAGVPARELPWFQLMRSTSPVPGAVADELQTKPVYLLWIVFTWKHQGISPPGAVPCHYVFTAESSKGFFIFSFFFLNVTQWRHTPERRGKRTTTKPRVKTQEIVTFGWKSGGLRVTTISVLANAW